MFPSKSRGFCRYVSCRRVGRARIGLGASDREVEARPGWGEPEAGGGKKCSIISSARRLAKVEKVCNRRENLEDADE